MYEIEIRAEIVDSFSLSADAARDTARAQVAE
jgi:hypothetical protein